MTNDTEWLNSLKEGDEVVRHYGYSTPSLELKRVDRVTPTLIVVGPERFRREDGYVVGHGKSYATCKIVTPSPELRGEIRKCRMVANLCRRNWSSLPLETLEQVYALLPKADEWEMVP